MPTPSRWMAAFVLMAAMVGLVVACSHGGGRTYPSPSGSPTGAGNYGGGVAFDGRDMPFDQVVARCRATGKPAMLYFTTS